MTYYDSKLQEFFDNHKDLPWTTCSDEGITFHIARHREYTQEELHLAIEQTPPDWFTKQLGIESFVNAFVSYRPMFMGIEYTNYTSLRLSYTEYGTIVRKVCFSLKEALDLLLYYHIISSNGKCILT